MYATSSFRREKMRLDRKLLRDVWGKWRIFSCMQNDHQRASIPVAFPPKNVPNKIIMIYMQLLLFE